MYVGYNLLMFIPHKILLAEIVIKLLILSLIRGHNGGPLVRTQVFGTGGWLHMYAVGQPSLHSQCKSLSLSLSLHPTVSEYGTYLVLN